MSHTRRFLVALVIITGSTAIILTTGNPQWHSLIYVAQRYWFGMGADPSTVHLIPEPLRPTDFTGEWRAWDPHGILIYRGHFVEGVPHGLHHVYSVDGTLRGSYEYDHGDPIGQHRTFDWKQQPQSIRDFSRHDINIDKTYDDGKMVKITITPKREPGRPTTIYDPAQNVDRRAEFGIPIK